MNADGIREEFAYRLARVDSNHDMDELLVKAVAEVAAQLSELVAEVRDISFDRLPDLPTGRLALRRRSDLLGWYTGARAARRVYL